jgi:hypothetical protein
LLPKSVQIFVGLFGNVLSGCTIEAYFFAKKLRDAALARAAYAKNEIVYRIKNFHLGWVCLTLKEK